MFCNRFEIVMQMLSPVIIGSDFKSLDLKWWRSIGEKILSLMHCVFSVMIENYQANRFFEPLRDCFFSESSIFILPSCPFNRNVIHNLKRLQSINFCSFVFLDWLWKQGDKEICTWFASVKMVQKVLLRTLVHLIAWEFCLCFTIL